MSYNFQAFFAIGLAPEEARAAGARVANALRAVGVLGRRIELDQGTSGVVSDRFETADEIARLFDATPALIANVGGDISIISGRYLNGWAFNQISEARCPACSALFKSDDLAAGRHTFESVLAELVDAVGPYFDDGEPGEVSCVECRVTSRADAWACDVAPGFSVLGVEFHHLPPFNSETVDTAGWSFEQGRWRVDVPQIISNAAGCRFGSTWGRI